MTPSRLDILVIKSFYISGVCPYLPAATMSRYYFIHWGVILVLLVFFSASSSSSWCPDQYFLQANRQFEQKTDRFWQYEEKSKSWVEVELPYDLVSCVDGNCTVVGSIGRTESETKKMEETEVPGEGGGGSKIKGSDKGMMAILLPLRKRVSVNKMSETSVWVTGPSGSIYERFWNGVKWVIAPHDLPVSAGPAKSVFFANQTIFALSEAGNLYQMQLNEKSQPVWIEVIQAFDGGTEQDSAMPLKAGAISDDGIIYFCTKNGSLLELSGIEPARWVNHGWPPGANVAAIADAAKIRPEVIYTISSGGDLYEYDRSSKPSWKKHIWKKDTKEDTSLAPLVGIPLHGLSGAHSASLFLLTKGGNLVERRLHQRKWKWLIHKNSEDHHFSAITPVLQDELSENGPSLFLTTASGTVWEYRLPAPSGKVQDNRNQQDQWVSHIHPPLAKVARGVPGIQFQSGRIIFPLDDGRLAELHLPGQGGEAIGPSPQVNTRRKSTTKYLWSVIDAPESEGWNTEYCTEENGPSNCILGIKDENFDSDVTRSRGRKGGKTQQSYLQPSEAEDSSSDEGYSLPDNWKTNKNFRLRVMHGGRSFFLITDNGLTYEYLSTENVWLWLRHEHSTAMRSAVGNYNGSLFLVDDHGTLLIRERSNNELSWINCTAMRKGRQIIGGSPWDKVGTRSKVTAEDALFFVSTTGRLMQFTVALRKFKWKDCKSPPSTKIASIVDQEGFRENIVFVTGKNGRLYQYNKVTEIWHEHYQSQHLVLSRMPGTAMRSSSSLFGSLFMLSEDGGLVEYQWNAVLGWNWVEHGTPDKSVTWFGSLGPCLEDDELFLIGSDGNVYLRYMDQNTWKWKNLGFPHDEERKGEEQGNSNSRHCDAKVAEIRPIHFMEDSVIFELRDGRLAEMRRQEKANWVWSRTIGTPTSLCISHYWTGLAS